MKLKFRVSKDGRKQIVVDLNNERENSASDFNNSLKDRDLFMVGDFRYFSLERFNYKRRYAI